MQISMEPYLQKMKNTICLSFFYRKPLTDCEDGLNLFNLLKIHAMEPHKFSITGKKKSYAHEEIRDFIRDVWSPFVEHSPFTGEIFVTLNWIKIFRTKNTRYWGQIARHGGEGANYHSEISFNLEGYDPRSNAESSLMEMVHSMLSYADCDFARVQYYSSAETLEGCLGREPNFTLVSRQLADCLPDLYNVTVWGIPYVKFFGKEKIMSSPCYKLEELSTGAIWMQLAPDVFNAKGSWAAIKDIRNEVKAHLNNDAFHDASLHAHLTLQDLEKDPVLAQKFVTGELKREAYRKHYKTPEFDLSEIRKPLVVNERDKNKS